mgnify:CR=1 FL=1
MNRSVYVQRMNENTKSVFVVQDVNKAGANSVAVTWQRGSVTVSTFSAATNEHNCEAKTTAIAQTALSTHIYYHLTHTLTHIRLLFFISPSLVLLSWAKYKTPAFKTVS